VLSLLAGARPERGELATRQLAPYGGALGLTRIDARAADAPDSILVAGRSQGLFAAPDERRVVLVEHAEALARTEVIERFPEDAALVLVAPEPMRSSRARGRKPKAPAGDLALLDAVETAGGAVERYDRLVASDVTRWVSARAQLHGLTLRADALDALASALGGDTERIENEVRKLAAWANGAPIAAADVHALVPGAIESDVFELTKAVVRRDVRTAAPLLARLLDEGNAPQQLLALLLWQFRVLLFAASDPKPADAERMAKAIRSSSGAILRYTRFARGLGAKDIARAYEALYACDISIKTGRAESDETALLLCVMDLCGIPGADLRDLLLADVPRRG